MDNIVDGGPDVLLWKKDLIKADIVELCNQGLTVKKIKGDDWFSCFGN